MRGGRGRDKGKEGEGGGEGGGRSGRKGEGRREGMWVTERVGRQKVQGRKQEKKDRAGTINEQLQ